LRFNAGDWLRLTNYTRLTLVRNGLLLVATGKADEEYIRVGITKLDFEAPAATEVKTITLV